MKPNYICVGVQKAGTTSLINYLNYHPKIYMANNEKHFFDRPTTRGQLTKADFKNYEKSFNTHKPIIGEKTPSYCYLRYAIDRIHNYNKDIKLIILLREPISRAFSQYNMYLNSKNQTLNDVTDEEIFENFVKENAKLDELMFNQHCFVIRGFYDEILEYILSKFPRNNVYIGISEEINKDKLKYYNEIYNFLGTYSLENIDINLDVHIREYKKNIPKKLEKYLYNIYEQHNLKLYEILGRKIDIWENYYEILKSTSNV